VTVFAGLAVILLLSVLASTMTGARFLSPSEWWRALVAPAPGEGELAAVVKAEARQDGLPVAGF